MGNRFGYPDMNDEIITKRNSRIVSFFASLDGMLDRLEQMAETCKPRFKGERYVTDKELSQRLKVSRRTLQDWHDNGHISFIHLGGKILYPESGIQTMLDKNFRKAWK